MSSSPLRRALWRAARTPPPRPAAAPSVCPAAGGRRAANASAAAHLHTSAPRLGPSAKGMIKQTADRNRKRGQSPLHRQPPQFPLEAEKYELPVPVPEAERPTKIETDPDHGLWGFFRDQKPLPTPEEDHKHGRAWAVEELRHKSWDDLHKLWWLCVRERNILATQKLERERLKPGYGEYEAQERDRGVRQTQRGIKHVLTERYYSWQEATKIAKEDPEINLSLLKSGKAAYTPKEYVEEETDEVVAAPSEEGEARAIAPGRVPEPVAEEEKAVPLREGEEGRGKAVEETPAKDPFGKEKL